MRLLLTLMTDRELLIHATNVTGLGARQVVQSLLGALAKNTDLRQAWVSLPLRALEDVGSVKRAGARILRQWRVGPNAMSRAWECLRPHPLFGRYRRSLVLGDIPLRGLNAQVVLVHQAHLVSPEVNRFSSSGLRFRAMRWVFRRNLAFVKTLVVQTGAMEEQMLASYPELKNRLVVIPQAVPHWFQGELKKSQAARASKLRLFYPAAGYPHKNHSLLGRMETMRGPECTLEVAVTLTGAEQCMISPWPPWVRNVGRLVPMACMAAYRETDALFFPSLLESYGLPLVEAMTLGLPIVCSDLPYAHWLCEDQAIYFDPTHPEAAWQAIGELQGRLAQGWQPDWRRALAKLPKDWDEVAQRFLEILGLAAKTTCESRSL